MYLYRRYIIVQLLLDSNALLLNGVNRRDDYASSMLHLIAPHFLFIMTLLLHSLWTIDMHQLLHIFAFKNMNVCIFSQKRLQNAFVVWLRRVHVVLVLSSKSQLVPISKTKNTDLKMMH